MNAPERMLPAHITRLMTFAQHGQPSGYAASDMMRADLEALISASSERQHHAALQRIGYALRLPPGADLHQQCVPAIEAFQRATHCNVCHGLLRAGNFHELCGAGMTTMCNCPVPPAGAQPTEDALEFALMRFAGLDKDNANHRAIAKQVLANVVAPQESVVNAPSNESAADEALWAILVGRAERYFSRDTGESDFDFLQRAIGSKPQKGQA